MRAAILTAPGRVDVDDVPAPELGPGQVLVRMTRASICGSDLHTVHGWGTQTYPAPPGFPGHEGVGVVVESRADGVAPGDHVLTAPLPTKAACFAELQAIDAANVLRLPSPGVADERLLMAQQLGTTIHAMQRFWPETAGSGAGMAAVVIGAGSAGLFFVQHLVARGFSQVVVSDLEPARLEVATRLGATTTVLAPDTSLRDSVLDLTGGSGAELVVEAVGLDATRAEAVSMARVSGTVGCFGLPERSGMVPFPFETAFRRGLALQMLAGAQSVPGLPAFASALAAITSGGSSVDHCLGMSYPLEQFSEAVAAADDRAAVKVQIEI